MVRCSRSMVFATVLIALCVSAAIAQSFPTKPIRIIVPAVPGSGPDVRMRHAAPKLAEALRQPVVVDNRPGANGAIGAQEAARSSPDGYTLFMGNINNALNDLLNPNPCCRLTQEFVPITRFAAAPLILLVHPSVPVASLKEFIDLAKAKPKTLTWASGGTGSLGQLLGEMIKAASRIDATEIPYKSTGADLTDLLAGHVMAGFNYAGVVGAHIKTGKLRALAVANARRLTVLPDVPTMAEAGLPGIEATGWNGIFAPARTPLPVVRVVHQEVARTLNSPEIKDQIVSVGGEIGGDTPEEFAVFVHAEMAKWGKVIKDAGIRLE
jgi:tripartite-type tricarboxylate transporter receptor subunit TctC